VHEHYPPNSLARRIALLPVFAHAGAVDQLHDFLKNTRTLKADLPRP
jgi:hypothetical protein